MDHKIFSACLDDLEFVDEANHIFSNHHDELINRIKKYLDNLDLLDS